MIVKLQILLPYATSLTWSLWISVIFTFPDFSPLLALPNLKEFHAVYSNFSNTRLLTHMKHLEVLDLSYTKAEHVDLSGLSQLFHLKELYCNGCYITSLKDIYPLAGLDVLSIFFNKIDAEEVRIFQKIYPDWPRTKIASPEVVLTIISIFEAQFRMGY